MRRFFALAMTLTFALSGCAQKKEAPAFAVAGLPPDVAGNTAPSAETAALNAEGHTIWDMPSYGFIDGAAPVSAIIFTDLGVTHVLELKNSVLHHPVKMRLRVVGAVLPRGLRLRRP